ncbi:MAG: molybdopterin-dependent oxidoreductase [Gammaproteobacteria bacterium]|nr:molybdopterin-dependent oxidoreductase [Gammaproteobacteria bacterium]
MSAGGKPGFKPIADRKTVPVYCIQCVAGPDLLKVEVEDGVATRIESNYGIQDEHPGAGRVCVKAYGLIQKTYNPHRIRQPMKRTNPLKGREHDPGFVPISWDEALDLVAEKLRGIRARGILDESGYPRLAFTSGGGGTPVQYMGTWPAFMVAWGKLDQGYGSGQGLKCYHSEHLYGELWHRAFIVSPDTPYCNYVINCGNNVEAAGGVAGIWREADARVRGLKRIQVEPHLSVSGAVSAEWVPIRPKTDAAFLYGLLHRILVETDWRKNCDLPFLEQSTNFPYLLGPHGYFLRDPETLKPLIWDSEANRARIWSDAIAHPAFEGTFRVSGVELGPDEERWEHRDIEVHTVFHETIEFLRRYTPEWAEAECDVPAATVRRVADEFIAHACIGETIEIEGQTLPLRPVAVMLGKTVNNGWGGYHACWARTLLVALVGALEVPGGLVGTMVKLNRPANDRHKSVLPTVDGFMEYPFNETSREGWQGKPDLRNAYISLVPLVGHSAWAPALGPAHLPWLFQKNPPAGLPRTTKPEVWICYRSNPAISSLERERVAQQIAEFPFTVAFAYTLDETNYLADVLLPEATDLESLQLIRIGTTKTVQQFWRHQGWAIRQPVANPVVDSRDMTDIATELARRVGILGEYNEAINGGAAGCRLSREQFDYGLDPNVAHGRDEIWDAVCKAASHELTRGEEVHGVDWFREHGFMLRPYPQLQWYLYPTVKKRGLRFELPYQERILRHGTQLARRLHEAGIDWWTRQLEEYQPLPHYESFPDIWINYAKEVGRDPKDYPFFALTARSMQYSWGANAGIPLINEIAQNVAGHKGVIINRGCARELGIAEGDPVVITSPVGETSGFAVLREGIRPDTVLMIGQFDHWAMPVAKDLQLPSLNNLTSIALSLTDSTGSSADLARVAIRKGSGPRRPA